MSCAASGSTWVSTKQYESMREQALAANLMTGSDSETNCLARQPEVRFERAKEQAGQQAVKGGSERLIVILADLVAGEGEGQTHG